MHILVCEGKANDIIDGDNNVDKANERSIGQRVCKPVEGPPALFANQSRDHQPYCKTFGGTSDRGKGERVWCRGCVVSESCVSKVYNVEYTKSNVERVKTETNNMC